MKRGLIAAGLLILLFALLLYNLHALDELLDALETHLCRSSAAWEAAERELAVSEAETAMDLWDSELDYLHIVIRQSEIDAVSDAFFDLLGELRSADGKPDTAFLGLLYHIDSLGRMDALKLSSVF